MEDSLLDLIVDAIDPQRHDDHSEVRHQPRPYTGSMSRAQARALGIDLLPPAQARTLAAVLRLYIPGEKLTVREIMDEAGYYSTSSTWRHLEQLRRAGLVTWDAPHKGTLRPCVEVIGIP